MSEPSFSGGEEGGGEVGDIGQTLSLLCLIHYGVRHGACLEPCVTVSLFVRPEKTHPRLCVRTGKASLIL